MERILSIQYLRAVAALAVVLFHALEGTPTRFVVGSAGVDIFFVISGFIIGVIGLDSKATPQSFFWRRCLRVLPPYWAATGIIFILHAIRPRAWGGSDFSFSNIAQSLLLIPHRDANGSPDPLLFQGWTLYYEMFFYIVVALAIFAPARLRAPLIVSALLVLVALGSLFRFENQLWAVYTSTMLLEFLAGLLIALLWRAKRTPPLAVGAACLAAGVAIFVAEHFLGLRGAGVDRVLIWGAPAALIVLGAISVEAAGKLPKLEPLRILGDASYSLYLLHVITFGVTSWAIGKTPFADMPLYAMAAVKIALAIAVALAFYAAFERPVLMGLKSLPKVLPRLAIGRA